MIVDDLDVNGVRLHPAEADPPLVVYPNAIPESGVKATSSGLERLQAVDLAEYVVDEVA